VVSAGEILEHVTDLPGTVAEICRVLRPGGRLVLDTIADTRIAAFVTVTIGERVPGGAPKGIHDPALFVNRKQLVAEAALHGVALQLRGLRPSFVGMMAWALRQADAVRLVPTRSTAVLCQSYGIKEAG